uniref:Ig-like domain-containing protein n=1 Tax=Anolis carolinensis TaxID=28377 RepID=R4GA69_ANOCA
MVWALLLSLLVTCYTGSKAQPVISQVASVSVSPANTAKIPCAMRSGLSIGSYWVSWYQQKPGAAPRFLLEYYSDSSKNHGSGVPSRFFGSKDTSSNSCYLNIGGVLAEDEADYYCAVWYNSECHGGAAQCRSETRISSFLPQGDLHVWPG